MHARQLQKKQNKDEQQELSNNHLRYIFNVNYKINIKIYSGIISVINFIYATKRRYINTGR